MTISYAYYRDWPKPRHLYIPSRQFDEIDARKCRSYWMVPGTYDPVTLERLAV